jgi:hypothetical protein
MVHLMLITIVLKNKRIVNMKNTHPIANEPDEGELV